MKPLDQFIKQNLADFNDADPPEGHFERFAQKLDGLKPQEKKRILVMLLKVAALIIFVFLVSFLFFKELRSWDDNLYSHNIATYDYEFIETERYYNDLLSTCYGKIEKLKFQDNRSEKKQVLQDLHEMDDQFELMKRDYMQYPDNELIMNAIINFYELKIEMMNNIISQVQ